MVIHVAIRLISKQKFDMSAKTEKIVRDGYRAHSKVCPMEQLPMLPNTCRDDLSRSLRQHKVTGNFEQLQTHFVALLVTRLVLFLFFLISTNGLSFASVAVKNTELIPAHSMIGVI